MQSQHYKGLIAEWYDDWLKEDTAHRDFFSGFFHVFQGQVLKLAWSPGSRPATRTTALEN